MASQQLPFRLSNTSECCHIWISISTPHLLILEVWTRGLTWWFSPWVLSDSWNPLDYSPSGSSVRGIFPARILEWVAMPSSSKNLKKIFFKRTVLCERKIHFSNPKATVFWSPFNSSLAILWYINWHQLWTGAMYKNLKTCGTDVANRWWVTWKQILENGKLVTLLAAAAKSLQSCPTLSNPIDGSPSRSPVSGILQARTLE